MWNVSDVIKDARARTAVCFNGNGVGAKAQVGTGRKGSITGKGDWAAAISARGYIATRAMYSRSIKN